MRKSIFGNLRRINPGNAPKKILHLDFANVTLGASTFSSTKSYTKSLTPSNLNASVATAFFDTGYVLQIQSIIDEDVVSAAAFDAILENATEVTTGPFGNSITAHKQIFHSKSTPPQTTNSPNQSWVRVLRLPPASSPNTNIDDIFVTSWRKEQIPTSLTLDQYMTSTPGARWIEIFEFKTGGYGGNIQAGDYRLKVGIYKDADGIYWNIQGDEKANNAAVPGVPSADGPTYWQLEVRYPVPPNNAWYRLDVWVQRHKAVNRTVVTVTYASDMITHVLCDKSSSGDLAGVDNCQEGVQRLPISRLFMSGRYSDGIPANYPLQGYIHDVQVWDKPPRGMELIDARNHGPLPWVPTPLSRATYYVSPTGVSGNSGTLGSPKDMQSAVNLTVPGNVIFMLAGTYSVTTAAHLNLWQDGTALKPIIYEAYPGHTVIIDGSSITPGVGNQNRVQMSGTYQKLRGVKVRNFPEYGVYIGGNYNTVDGCELSYNKLSGLIAYVAGAGPWTGASYNTIINNWIHHNSDVGLFTGNYNNGGNADGIGSMRGQSNLIAHNLVEYNSDDGIDAWTSWGTIIKYNISRYNGLGAGNGNGIKAGGNSTGKNAVVNNNSCYGNLNVGIDYNTGINVTMRNNTTYLNATGYGLGTDTINIRNVSNSDTAVKFGTGIATRNSWDITGTLTFISTVEGNANFLKVTQDGTFDGIGKDYV